MRDLMVDIETLGTKPGSVILSIGAVAFDALTGEIGEEFYASINPASATHAGLTIDAATVQWWMEQSEEARRSAFAGGRQIGGVLAEFSTYIRRASADRVWAKPPSFDLLLIESAFRACGMETPWDYRSPRDCRTLFDLTGTTQPSVGIAHNALDDAKAQAMGVIEAYARFGSQA